MLVSLQARRFRPTVASTWLRALRTCTNLICLAGAVGFLTALSFVAKGAGTVDTISMPGITSIEVAADGAPVVIDGAGARHLVRLVDGQIAIDAVADYPQQVLPLDALPDAEVAVTRGFDRAWLGAQTDRYSHGVLGDAIEAGALYLSRGDGPVQVFSLGKEAVFEDRYPRFADMNGDGDPEILVVKSYLHAGAALVLIDPDISPLSITAETDAIGTPNRWLNPVGVGDVDNDGRAEALVVITPHIGGRLTAYEWQGNRLVKDHELDGFSNHQIGSRELALSAVADLDDDGVAEAIVPDASRQVMQIVRFDRPAPQIVASVAELGRVAHRLVVHDFDDDGLPELIWGTEDGTLVMWRPAF